MIELLQFPQGKYIRVDTGFVSGSLIPSNYDSMIAKLIVKGETREKAISNAINALAKFRVKGLKSTVPFNKAVLKNADFKSGNLSTSFIEKQMNAMFYQEKDEEMLAAFIALTDYLEQMKAEDELEIDFEGGKKMAPWLLNKRMKSF